MLPYIYQYRVMKYINKFCDGSLRLTFYVRLHLLVHPALCPD